MEEEGDERIESKQNQTEQELIQKKNDQSSKQEKEESAVESTSK